MRKKKCKNCKEWFEPERQFQNCCTIRCAIEYAREQGAKKKKKELRERVLGNDKKHQTQLAQKAFNQFIRLRDADEPCISCQRHHKGQYHAGHYRSVGSAPNLRFNELNVNKQCSACNNYKSGNIGEYRINLIKKIGIEAVERLEADHTPKKYTIEEIINIKKYYREKCRELEAA